VRDQALIKLEREVTRLTVESNEPILAAAGTYCENQSSPTDSINNITCVSDYFQKQRDMLSPYQLENLTSLVNGNLVLLEQKYRALPHLEHWECLIDMCLGGWYDEMVRDHSGISYKDGLTTKNSSSSSLAYEWLTTATNTNSSRSDSVEISDSGSLLARLMGI